MPREPILFWFLLNIVLFSTYGDVCIYQSCQCNGDSITCSDRGLRAIPPKVPTSKTSFANLDLDENMITTIPAGSLPDNLTELSMMNNPLKTIDDLAFNSFSTTLQSLTISTAYFTKLPDAFLNLKHLTSLTISDSTVLDWNLDAMKSLGQSVNWFFLENCGITGWPIWMQYFTNLTMLSLSSNFISSIPDHALDKIAGNLTSLSLVNTSLTSIPQAMSVLSALTSLYIEQNKISDVSWMPKLSQMNIISINNNHISDANQLSKALKPYQSSLNHIDIEANLLTSIPNLSFMTQIGAIDFSNNRISDPFSGSLPPTLYSLYLESNSLSSVPKVLMTLKGVSEILLSSNAISEIRADDFPPWTVDAHFGFNLISELTDSSFPENCSLQFLELNNNPLSRISTLAFKNVPLLNELNLQNTKLTRLPLGLQHAGSLQYVDFTGSDHLVCTCMEKGLESWIMKLTPDKVTGNCGQASIFMFYTTLSRDCPT